MNAANKAIWFIESHLGGDLSLENIAVQSGVSRFHLSRAFATSTGRSLMSYVRGRRLSEAARALAKGAPDILTVALEAGYSSHEAFTRAFREQFGTTPEAVRAQGHPGNLSLVEPLVMNQTIMESLAPPRFVNSKPLLLVGLSERYNCESSAGVPAQWQRFLPHFGTLPGQLNRKAYGAMYNFDDEENFDYLCGVEVPDFSRTPRGFTNLRIPEQRYVVFAHTEHISTIRRTWNTVWNSWFASSGHEPADAPYFELYGENFNGQTGLGDIELWVPLR